MRSETALIKLHHQLRKTAFERVGPALVQSLTDKLAGSPEETRDARTRQPR